KCFFFFFQAEDGIRDRNVTGVQTCALPILLLRTQSIRIFLPDTQKRSGTIQILTAKYWMYLHDSFCSQADWSGRREPLICSRRMPCCPLNSDSRSPWF